MVDALKNFMSSMTGTITQQVTKQVRRIMEAATSARPLPHFDYVPTAGCEPSHRHRGSHFLRKEREPAQPEPRDEECFKEIVATIVGRYAEGITRSAWKAQLRGAQQVLTVEQGSRVTVPTMVFGAGEGLRFSFPHNDPLVVEMKMANVIVWRILIDTGSSIDIITWDCL
ncbi:hypothetical protein Cgig2_010439 [Carnegiea gigantea]|uniref:Uncharacterized protein n=1 Tax=Carnegiea gigantea TaxID=171969 RepID=A0A9Q1JMT2_9CARY|nr:hypothetical protein Cgig2_010439 [Carnegiea gigantea]